MKQYVDHDYHFKIVADEAFSYSKGKNNTIPAFGFFDDSLLVYVLSLDENPYNVDANINSQDKADDYTYTRKEISEKELIDTVTDSNNNIIRVQKIIVAPQFTFLLIVKDPIFYSVAEDYFNSFSLISSEEKKVGGIAYSKGVTFSSDLSKTYSIISLNGLKEIFTKDLNDLKGSYYFINGTYFYDHYSALTACPQGYALPTQTDFINYFNLLKNDSSLWEEDFLNIKYKGYIDISNALKENGSKALFWTREDSKQIPGAATAFMINNNQNKISWGFISVDKNVKLAVRCMKK